MNMYKLIINFKTYKESFSVNGLKIARACKNLESYAQEKGVELIVCPHIYDLKDIIKTGVNVYAQHFDLVDFGPHTGHIVPEALKELKVCGSLISHSEDLEDLEVISKKIALAKQNGLLTCVCARNDKVVKGIAEYEPDYIAVEPKELIGGDISISTANPELILKSIKSAGNVNLLVGAGIKNREDVKIALKLGAKGILVASGIVKSQDPQESIKELLEGF